MNGPISGGAGTAGTARLLWEACRRDPAPEAIWAALGAGAAPRRVVELAAAHGLVPLLRRALAAAGALDEFGPAREVLDTAADAFKMEALLLLPSAVSLAVRPLTEVGLEPVVMRGPAVARRYPEPGLRPMGDIDVLLPESDHFRALAALRGAGWRVARPTATDLYDTVLTHPEVPTLLLELHYGLERNTQRLTKLDPLALWALRRPMDCAGTPAFGLPLTEELVVMAAHAGKPFHHFGRLLWIADLAMIVGDAARQGAAIDWDALRVVADRARCRTVLTVALAMAQRAGVVVPPGLVELPEGERHRPVMRQLLSVDWPLVSGEFDGFRRDYRLSMADRRAQRAKLRLVLAASKHQVRSRLRRAVVTPQRMRQRASDAA